MGSDDETLTFDDWEGVDDKFALQVCGDSMIDEQIRDGDFVVIQKAAQSTVKNGQIIALRDDDGEATLKRYFNEGHRIRLEPANKKMRPVYREKIEVLGVLVGVVRKY